MSAEETASALGVNVGAANSALFRARSAVEHKLGGSDAGAIRAHAQVDEQLLRRYVDAFEAANLDAIVALFHADMRTTMPPVPLWIAGRTENERVYRRLFARLTPGQFRHLYTRANAQPALAFYRPAAPGAPHTLHAIQLITTRDGAVASVDHFMQPELLAAFGAPRQLP